MTDSTSSDPARDEPDGLENPVSDPDVESSLSCHQLPMGLPSGAQESYPAFELLLLLQCLPSTPYQLTTIHLREPMLTFLPHKPLGLSASSSTTSSELSHLGLKLHQSLRQFPDFPSPGILFEDILPIFNDPTLHESLIRALQLHIENHYGSKSKPDVIVGLEARGFLFGPSLALRLGAGFVPIRKKGKLPGPTETASYKKEYGEDYFQIQADAIRQGQKVIIVDDIIATGTFTLTENLQCFSTD